MNRARVVVLLRELADAIEEEDPPRPRKPRVEITPAPVDDLARRRAQEILKRKGINR